MTFILQDEGIECVAIPTTCPFENILYWAICIAFLSKKII